MPLSATGPLLRALACVVFAAGVHQVAPGPEMLTTPEPRFYVLGSKS